MAETQQNLEARPKVPSNVKRALMLIFFSILLFLLANLLVFLSFEVTDVIPQTIFHYSNLNLLIGGVVHCLFVVLLMQYIYLGHRWAAYVYVIYVIARVILHFTTHSAHFMSATTLMVALIYFALQVIITWLLFTSSSRAWFEQSQAWRARS